MDYEGDRDIWVEASEQRADLIDKMADLDDNLANLIIERESLQKINPVEMNQALRRITLARVSLQFSFTQDNAVMFLLKFYRQEFQCCVVVLIATSAFSRY